MKIAIFDPFSGVSGNMILGALIDSGLDVDELVTGLGTLPLSGWGMTAEKVVRSGLRGTFVEVGVPHEHKHRHLSDIREIVEASDLPLWVKRKSVEAFTLLAEAEAAAHGTGIEEVHFHEVGAVDAIIDVVGSCLGIHLLGVESVYSSAVALGTGTVSCAHGILPVPVPATTHLLKGVPVTHTGEPSELTTPTGAALLKALVHSWGPPPACVAGTVGMGAGSREGQTRANLLRLVTAEVVAGDSLDSCIRMEAVVDDLDPRIWPVLNRKILGSGALDCYARNCFGKKGRPAMEVVVHLPLRARESVLTTLFSHSSTLGVRVAAVERVVLHREIKRVSTQFGDIAVKLAYHGGRLVSAEPEFDECASAADAAGVSVKLVLQAAKGVAASHFFGR